MYSTNWMALTNISIPKANPTHVFESYLLKTVSPTNKNTAKYQKAKLSSFTEFSTSEAYMKKIKDTKNKYTYIKIKINIQWSKRGKPETINEKEGTTKTLKNQEKNSGKTQSQALKESGSKGTKETENMMKYKPKNYLGLYLPENKSKILMKSKKT